MLISNRCISGLMSNLIKKSWTVSNSYSLYPKTGNHFLKSFFVSFLRKSTIIFTVFHYQTATLHKVPILHLTRLWIVKIWDLVAPNLIRSCNFMIPAPLFYEVNSKLTKLFNICWKLLLLKSIKSTCFQQTFNNFVSFELLFTKLSGIHPYEKCIK